MAKHESPSDATKAAAAALLKELAADPEKFLSEASFIEIAIGLKPPPEKDDKDEDEDDAGEGKPVSDEDVAENPNLKEHSARVADPSKFEKGSFRSKSAAPGVRLILGKLKGKDAMSTQSIRFDKSKFSPEEAEAWLEDKGEKFEKFEPAAEEE